MTTDSWFIPADQYIKLLGESKLQQPMPTQSDSDPSFSPGILKLLELYTQISALHSTFVGTYSDQLANFPTSTGTEITARQRASYASFARVQQEMRDCILAVNDAVRDSIRKKLVEHLTPAGISTPTDKP